MKIHVLSRELLESIISSGKPKTWSGNWALISISGYLDSGPVINETTSEILASYDCTKILALCFLDITSNEFPKYQKANPDCDDSFLFNKTHARQILKFVANFEDERRLVVQCAAGVSRSGAVGLFLNRYLKLDERKFRKMNSHIEPNDHVLDVLMRTSGLRDEYVRYWESF